MTSSKQKKSGHLSHWAAHHIFCFIDCFQRMKKNLLSTTITLGMIAVALAVPLAIFSVVDGFKSYFESWENAHEVTLFLQKGISDSRTQTLLNELAGSEFVHNSHLIKADQALSDFAKRTDMTTWVEALSENPLPNMIVATANTTDFSARQLQEQFAQLSEKNGIERIVFDYVWLERLQAMITVGERFGIVLSILLSITVVLVIINTVRWEIESRRDELRILQLVGGTTGYIRRPFLYTGFVFGSLGSLFALILVSIALAVLTPSIHSLFALYEATAPELTSSGIIYLGALAIGSGLGLLGAWTAVNQQLQPA